MSLKVIDGHVVDDIERYVVSIIIFYLFFYGNIVLLLFVYFSCVIFNIACAPFIYCFLNIN